MLGLNNNDILMEWEKVEKVCSLLFNWIQQHLAFDWFSFNLYSAK